MTRVAGARFCQRASETTLLAVVCVAPWAFGAVEAWAELILDFGIVLLSTFGALAAWLTRSDPTYKAKEFSLPGLALACLVLLALFQAMPLPGGLIGWISPSSAVLHSSLIPQVAERVAGDSLPAVALPPATLSENPEASLQAAARLAAAWVLFQSVVGFPRGYAASRRLGLALTVNATLLSLFSLIQLLTWNGKIYWYRPSPSASAGPFVCHSHLAAYLNCGVGFALAFLLVGGKPALGARSSGFRPGLAYAAVIIALGIITSLSRNGFLGMVIGAGLMLVFLRPSPRTMGVALGTVVMLMILFLVSLGDTTPYQERINTLVGYQPYQHRIQIWADAVRAWPVYPFWGTGLGTFPAATARFFRQKTDLVFAHAENEYVEWLVEGGIVGVALLLILLFGVWKLAREAWRSAALPTERGLVLGLGFGCLTMLIDGLSDFALHIPGVSIVALVLCAHLCKLGIEARTPIGLQSDPKTATLSLPISALTLPALAVVVLIQGINLARSEAAYRASGLSWPGNGVRSSADPSPGLFLLAQSRVNLERSLAARPNWGEGHQRLGQLLVDLYSASVVERLRKPGADFVDQEIVSNHLWLHGRVHSVPNAYRPSVEELLDDESVRTYLVPAARAFLEARRSCPVLPIPHLELASLDYLLEGSDPERVMLDRALRLAGSNTSIVTLVGQLALQSGDRDTLVRCLKKRLSIKGADWSTVIESSDLILTPPQIIAELAPSGRLAIFLAERFDLDAENHETRDLFLREALRRLPEDGDLSKAERFHLKAYARSLLGDRPEAEMLMLKALELEPKQFTWRKEFVHWLIVWGRSKEAHTQALVGVSLTPHSVEARQALALSVDALARGISADDRAKDPER